MSKRPPYPSDLADKTLLRFPAGLKQRIEEAAKANKRSMNAEIIATLEEKYPPPPGDELLRFYVLLDEMLSEAKNPEERRYLLKKLMRRLEEGKALDDAS